MSEPFLGQMQIFGFNFAPKDWAQCAGQIMPISQNTALFSLLGVNFGGDGKATFGLPNFIGSAACAVGQGPGLSPRSIGETFGTETVTLNSTEMPMHSHTLNIFGQNTAAKRHGTPVSNDALVSPTAGVFTTTTTASGIFPVNVIGQAGGSQPHNNQQPYLVLNFCIALSGVFPQRP
ncbi:MAG: phage tail protein [Rhodanobacter sp.]